MNKWYWILGGCIVSLITIAALTISSYKNKLNDAEQNITAYKGKIEQLELKNGELISMKDSYILKNKELQEMFDMSKKEIRDLEKKLGDDLAYITKIETVVKYDTIRTTKDSIIYKDNTIPTFPINMDIKFEYKDKWMCLNGVTSVEDTISHTSITNLSMDVPLKVGLADNYKIFVQSDNPYVNFNSIEGAVVDGSKFAPKKKRFSWGIQVGAGVMYDALHKNIAVGPYGGLGVEFNF
jgi:hypothetical protein